jgi:hypothetical protein
MTARKTLPEPLVIEKFWANRSHIALVVSLETFEQTNLIDIRKHVIDPSGRLVPTPKGIALKITRLPDLQKAITKALKQARALGLLPPDEGSGK